MSVYSVNQRVVGHDKTHTIVGTIIELSHSKKYPYMIRDDSGAYWLFTEDQLALIDPNGLAPRHPPVNHRCTFKPILTDEQMVQIKSGMVAGMSIDGQDLTGPGFAFTHPTVGMSTVAVAEAEVTRTRAAYIEAERVASNRKNEVDVAHANLRKAKAATAALHVEDPADWVAYLEEVPRG